MTISHMQERIWEVNFPINSVLRNDNHKHDKEHHPFPTNVSHSQNKIEANDKILKTMKSIKRLKKLLKRQSQSKSCKKKQENGSGELTTLKKKHLLLPTSLGHLHIQDM